MRLCARYTKYMSFLLRMHARLLFTLLIVFVVLIVWGLISFFRSRALSRVYAGALIVAELLLLSEVVIGVLLTVNGAHAYRQATHIMYGVVAVLTLPMTMVYLRGRNTRWDQLIYVAACLFLSAIVLRVLETGHGPG